MLVKAFGQNEKRSELSPSFSLRRKMKIPEKEFPSVPLLSALLFSVLFFVACGDGNSGTGGGNDNNPGGSDPADETLTGNVVFFINSGEARTGQRRVNLSVGILNPGSEVDAYLVSSSSATPDVSDASSEASSDVVFDVWRNIHPTTDTFVETYLDATLDSSSDGTQTLHLWFKDRFGRLFESSSDSIALYTPAGKVRDAGQTACYNATADIACPTDPDQDFFGQEAQYDGLLSTYTAGVGLREGTVRDNLTGLVWRKDLDSTADGGITFVQLTALCDALNLGGYDDWRVPTAREAQNLLAYGSDSTYPAPFEGTAAAWTRTPLSTDGNRHWVMRATASTLSNNLNSAGTETANLCVRGTSWLPFDYGFTARGTGTADTTDDTVVESRTGLTWDRRETTGRNWQNALSYCADSTHEGKTDWRLPSFSELLTLLDYTDTSGARIHPAFTDATADYYWTSTTRGSLSPNTAFAVYFAEASFFSVLKTNPFLVRCVRND